MDAVVAPSQARIVEVAGADRASFLDDVTTQALRDIEIGRVRSTLYLDVHGAPLAVFDVIALHDRLALLVPDEQVASVVVETLGMRTFLADARFEATGDTVVSLRGDDAHAAARAAGLEVAPGRAWVDDEVLRVGRSNGIDLIGPAEAVEAVVEALTAAGARRGDPADLDAVRVRAGEPAWGVELVAPHLPEELGLLPTHVHLAKGCYPGQEAVARMWMLGRPRRRLARVRAASAVAPGWEAGSGRKRVTVTSTAPDGEVRLAFVPGDAAEGEVHAGDDGVSVEIVALLGAGTDVPGHDPAVPRRRDQRAKRAEAAGA